MSLPALELISLKLCPFVQRAVIALKHKNIPFEITYIDVNNPPEWFKLISPLGQVPVLKVGDEVLFESNVIAEYVDEITPPSLHPTDPLVKAKHRAWMAFAGELMGGAGLYGLTSEKDAEAFSAKLNGLKNNLSRVEAVHSGQSYFAGEDFHLVDAVFAPTLMRLDWIAQYTGVDALVDLPKLKNWQAKLLARPCVQNSVLPEVAAMYRAMIDKNQGQLASLLKPETP